MFANPIEVSQYVAAGKLKYLLASTKDRVASLPTVPSAGDLGIVGLDIVACSASWPLRPRPRTSSAACRRKSGRSSLRPR